MLPKLETKHLVFIGAVIIGGFFVFQLFRRPNNNSRAPEEGESPEGGVFNNTGGGDGGILDLPGAYPIIQLPFEVGKTSGKELYDLLYVN